MPLSFIATTYPLVNHDFEFERTLETGELVFSGHTIKDYNASGTAIANIVVFDKTEMDNYAFLSHEFTHVYQYYDFNIFNTSLNKLLQNLKVNYDTFDKVSNHLYYDLQGFIFYPLYFSEIQNIDCHYHNFFETEVGYYSNRIFCNYIITISNKKSMNMSTFFIFFIWK